MAIAHVGLALVPRESLSTQMGFEFYLFLYKYKYIYLLKFYKIFSFKARFFKIFYISKYLNFWLIVELKFYENNILKIIKFYDHR